MRLAKEKKKEEDLICSRRISGCPFSHFRFSAETSEKSIKGIETNHMFFEIFIFENITFFEFFKMLETNDVL